MILDFRCPEPPPGWVWGGQKGRKNDRFCLSIGYRLISILFERAFDAIGEVDEGSHAVNLSAALSSLITMRKPIINDRKLLELIDKQGMSQSAAAKALGVSRQAVSKRLQELRGKTTRAIVAKKVEQVVDQKIDAIEQLHKINSYANELLDLLMRWNRGDSEALQVLESQVKRVKLGESEELEIQEVKFKDPRELALKAMGEIRNQLKLQLEMFQALFSLQAAEEFQQAVLEAIGEVSPDVRNQIIRRINEKRSVRSAVRFS